MDGYQRGRARRDIRIILGIYNPLSHALRDVIAEDVDLQLQNAVELVAMKHTPLGGGVMKWNFVSATLAR